MSYHNFLENMRNIIIMEHGSEVRKPRFPTHTFLVRKTRFLYISS